jgi:hypothetical protein
MSKPDIFERAPHELLSVKRFDVMFKYLYAKSRESKWDTSYHEEAYLEHIRAWNGFSEYDSTDKNSKEAFLRDFHQILDSIRDSGFDETVSTVPIQGDSILNGSHRLAGCLLHDVPVKCVQGQDGKDGQHDCSWYFFTTQTQTNPIIYDRAALEYVKLSSKMKLITLFPIATRRNLVNQTRDVIGQFAKLFYEKPVFLNQNGAVNLMRELYWQEKWAESNGGRGFFEKANLCFGGRVDGAPVVVFFAEFESQADAVECKKRIREIYKVANHSVHINDTHDESIRIAKTVLNNNSIQYLNSFDVTKARPARLTNLLSEYQRLISSQGLDLENYAVSAGAVISRFGLKVCKDVDYIHKGPALITSNPDIQSHNEYGVALYPTNYDNIIFNPLHHFYVHGIKFASLPIVRGLKANRQEPKDFTDIALIDQVLV